MKITKDQFEQWYGYGENDDLADYVVDLINGEFSIEDARNEIIQYNEQ